MDINQVESFTPQSCELRSSFFRQSMQDCKLIRFFFVDFYERLLFAYFQQKTLQQEPKQEKKQQKKNVSGIPNSKRSFVLVKWTIRLLSPIFWAKSVALETMTLSRRDRKGKKGGTWRDPVTSWWYKIPFWIHGTVEYLLFTSPLGPPFLMWPFFHRQNVGKYTYSLMDPMGRCFMTCWELAPLKSIILSDVSFFFFDVYI